MANDLRVTLEIGPKCKKVVAVAPDWPGLERGAKTGEAAIERLQSYLPRYAKVAKLAGMDAAFAAITTVEVVEQYLGTGSTDFWGISFAFSGLDRHDMSSEELERELTLMQACWAFFDDVRVRVSAEMQKGPRGGGRDRDQIVRHTCGTEQDWAEKVVVRTPQGAMLTDEGLNAHRDAYRTAIRAFHAEGKMARTWPLRYLIRHTAYHTLDHAWEMEDKDLTGGVRLGATNAPSSSLTSPGYARRSSIPHAMTQQPQSSEQALVVRQAINEQLVHHGDSLVRRPGRWRGSAAAVASRRAPAAPWSRGRDA